MNTSGDDRHLILEVKQTGELHVRHLSADSMLYGDVGASHGPGEWKLLITQEWRSVLPMSSDVRLPTMSDRSSNVVEMPLDPRVVEASDCRKGPSQGFKSSSFRRCFWINFSPHLEMIFTVTCI